MRNTVNYEWCIEIVDGNATDLDSDIMELIHADSLSDIHRADIQGADKRLVLIRDEGNEHEGLVDRSWCYVHWIPDQLHPILPERFQSDAQIDQTKVTQTKRKEFNQWIKRHYNTIAT